MSHDNFIIKLWTDGVFGASKFPIEELELEIRSADFGVIILGPDDRVFSRDSEEKAPRDNVVFELGMCMGALTRERTFMVLPKNVPDLKIPTDLMGVTPLKFDIGPENDIDVAVGPVCEELRRIMKSLGVK